jgi:opacity protein-like surface antigen
MPDYICLLPPRNVEILSRLDGIKIYLFRFCPLLAAQRVYGNRSMKSLLIALSLAVVLFGVTAAPAQEAKRIEFAKGKTSATVSGVTGAYGVSYVVRARSGQKITLKLTPAMGVGIKVETDGRDGQEVLLREESGGSYVVGLEESGDYTIFIGSTSGKSKNFTLTISITKMTDI